MAPLRNAMSFVDDETFQFVALVEAFHDVLELVARTDLLRGDVQQTIRWKVQIDEDKTINHSQEPTRQNN